MKGKKLVIANWKMHPLTRKDAEKLALSIAKRVPPLRKTEMIICPPLIYLEEIRKASRKIVLGAQDAFWGDTGAFTGEVSAEMLALSGVRYVILGHSERRSLGESNADVGKKIKSALAAGLRPIVCVGEEVRDQDHNYFNTVQAQLKECLQGVSKNSIGKVIVAYEPIWAISSTPGRRDATPEDSNEMVIFIRKVLADKFGKDASSAAVVYGGSVTERDAEEFLREGGVDGLLVGRASLSPDKFARIVTIAEKI